MDKIIKYRKIIKDLLEEYALVKPAFLEEVENQLVFDEAGDHYLRRDMLLLKLGHLLREEADINKKGLTFS
ncbi:MAG: element excision factor XisI family protein [Bacteroidota bacterium]